MLARPWILLLLLACGPATSRAEEWWSLDTSTWEWTNASGDDGCDHCDSLSDAEFWGQAECDGACDSCPSCSMRAGGDSSGSGCSRLAYWNRPAENFVDRILPRSNLPFPLLKGLVEGRDVPLPLHLGSGVVFTEMDRNVAVSDVRLGLGDDTPMSVDRVSVPTSKFHASSQIARLDLWVLPCLNLYGIVGHTKSTGDITVTVDRFPLPGSPPVDLRIPVELKGTTAGWGMTTGIGAKNWFAMLDINKTWTDFSQLDSSLTALVIAPRVGMPIDRPCFKGEMHVGAMWQDTNQTVELTLDHPILGDGLHVEVDQFEPRPWNFLVGGLWAINERLLFMVEGGMGGRSYVISGITLRH
ncbi:hypothetical protein FYK55_03595 [Roseiconus nitratireducens]|uniref:Uncharacterized protein n=1 Tax=Roseiconus nitratireducens TaxID=2605748 RepID=A0A5M6DF41_9BACT|nr:hypothetical protein [Roseiconus nitratireducens]KAA5546003.1 hypothetical protein FYK55_03595 [Roseiconus nitratireducens]